MAKDKLTDYSATNASNTDIGGINIDEGMLPSAVNNALREQMTHLKNFSDGTDAIDALTVSSSSSGEFNALTISQANNTSGNESRIRFKRTTDAGADREVAAIVADRVGGNDTALVFETNTDGSDGATERARISHDGKFGVGTNSPQSVTHFKGTSSGENILHLDNSAGSGHGDTNNNVRVVSGDNGYWANLVIAGHQLEFKVQGGTSMLRVDSDGVKFHGDTAAANALDDYEEGTWTATLTGSASAPSTAVTTTGNYRKIGRLVFVECRFANVNTTGASGTCYVTGFPYSSVATFAGGDVMSQYTLNVNSTSANIAPFFANSTTLQFQQTRQSIATWVAASITAGAGRYLYMSMTYPTSS